MAPNGFAMRSSRSEGLCFRWKERTMATDTVAMYTERRRLDRNASCQIPEDE